MMQLMRRLQRNARDRKTLFRCTLFSAQACEQPRFCGWNIKRYTTIDHKPHDPTSEFSPSLTTPFPPSPSSLPAVPNSYCDK